MSTEPTPYLVHPVSRVGSAFRVTGPRYWIELSPSSSLDGRVYVDVVQLPNEGSNPSDRPARLTYSEDSGFDYLPGEITVTEEQLVCHKASRHGPAYYRTGFVLDLDSAMADALRSALRHVCLLSEIGVQVGQPLARELEARQESIGHFEWLLGAVRDAVTAALLDGADPAASVDAALASKASSSSWGDREEAFQSDARRLICETVRAFTPGALAAGIARPSLR